MWSQIALCLLVGLAYATTQNPGWKDNTEYTYLINGRTLASLHEVADQYSGILLRAKLNIRPRSDGTLQGRIFEAQYAQVHSHLPEGWRTDIPESELSYKTLALSEKPFQMAMKDGVIRDLIVEKEVPNWEANIIKSIASQFQLDTQGKNLVDSHVNTLPGEDQNNAVFKTMEDTVTGNTETLYEIHPLPEYVLQSKPWLAPQVNLKGDGDLIEIVKHKNYSRSQERPSYHFGLSGMDRWEPASNQMGDFFIRNSVSRAVLTGKLNRFTIQNSYTVNKIIMSPTLDNKQKGLVVSMLNVTLSTVRTQSGTHEDMSSPISLGNLVYRYNSPYTSNEARPKKQYDNKQYSDESNSASSSSEEQDLRLDSPSMGRFRRSYEQQIRKQDSRARWSSSSEEQNWQEQDKPKMDSAPETPLLPYMMGYHGNSIRKDRSFDVQQNVQKLAQEIGQDLQQPEAILKENALSKFTILSSLIRLMNAEELKQTAQKLYTQSEKGPARATWITYRDAVAQCGTGPAFLTIQDWIQSQKIKGEEAAELVSTMAHSVRVPTEEYMRQFFELVKKSEVKSQEQLNETAILAYTSLVSKVYVNKYQSHNQYPVHSFGSFNTEQGRKWMKDSVIPYLTEQLHEAISRGDTRKIHVYTRALGNVGHKKILQAFEPYLEGTKQCSQFQRLFMVVCMDKLVQNNPIVARSVLYKIYQNAGETQEVRVAAVYQLMRTSPPTDMLQRMAEYTRIDTQEHVNAAVKSAIESAAELKGDAHKYLRSSAEAAKPLLTEKVYGKQYGSNYLRDYVVKELNMKFKQNIQQIGSEDEFMPKGFEYSLRAAYGGMTRREMKLQSMISSIDQLIHVMEEQTESYKQAKQQQQEGQNKWSSHNIAKLLNLQSQEREQLEGSFYLEAGSLQKLLSFNNQTIEQLPEVIRKYEEMLRNGKNILYTKIINDGEIALSFPMEMGFPFLYTCDTPILIDIQGKLQATATPQVSQGNKLHKPETISSRIDIYTTLSKKIQSRLTFVTPFDHQQYIAGFEKNMQVHVPLHGNIEIDMKSMQMKAEFEPKEIHPDARLFHYSTWPYTSRSDIMTLRPVSSRPNTHVINKEGQDVQHFDKIIGKKQTGLAFRVHGKHQYHFMDLISLSHLLKNRDGMTAFLSFWNDAAIQQTEISVTFIPQNSSARKITVRLGCKHEYRSQPKDQENDNTLNWTKFSKYSTSDSTSRQEEFMNRVGAGIHSAQIGAVDASIEFQGDKEMKYIVTGAVGKSNVDAKSRVLFYYKKSSTDADIKPFQMTLQVKNIIPNTNGLDLAYSMKNEPTVKSEVQFEFGSSEQSPSKIQAQIELRRSQERKQYLFESPLYQVCKRQMQEGNRQLLACANMTMEANLLDDASIQLKHENLRPDVAQLVKVIYDAIRVNYAPSLEVRRIESGDTKQVDIKVCFQPDLKAVNVSVRTAEEETSIKHIHVPEWAKQVFVVHPVFHLCARLYGNVLGLKTYRPICVVDQTLSKTFNNRTYPSSLGNEWTVMLQYVPKQARQHSQEHQQSVEEQLQRQIENYVVLVRQNQQNKQQKDIKITVRTPETDGKVIDITMKPVSAQQTVYSGSNPSVKVTVDEQEIRIDDKQSHDVKGNYIQVYALPNGEVKVEVRDVFYVIYDGERVKLTALSGKFRDSNRGLCGPFNDDETEDLLTAENCVAKDSHKFLESYKVEQGQQRAGRSSEHQLECREKVVPLYANVISDFDAGRDKNYREKMQQHSGMCTKYQTRYIERDGEICFTIRPMPVCHRCQQRGTISKTVAVHCVQKSNVAQLWKSQIDKGASPDFSLKQETGTVRMELPKTCSL